jgi:hypothetical protein
VILPFGTRHATIDAVQMGCTCRKCNAWKADARRNRHLQLVEPTVRDARGDHLGALHGDKPSGWMEHAACQGEPPDTFFPRAMGDTHAAVAAAKAVCAECSVRLACLTYAQTKPYEIWGIWGGYTPRERAQLRRKRK